MQTLSFRGRPNEARLPGASAPAAPLAGKRILIVEDDWLVGREVAGALEEAGARIVGPFPTMIDALENLCDLTAIDAAVLDIGLGADNSYPLAEALSITRVPFLFLTGVDRDRLPEQFRRAQHMLKPFRQDELVESLLAICDR